MTRSQKPETGTAAARAVLAAVGLVAGLLLLPMALDAATPPPAPPRETPVAEAANEAAGATETAAPSTEQTEAARLAEKWGIEVTSIRLTAHDHMIDFRYRVLDPAKAEELFIRQNHPSLIHQETEKVLVVPATAKTGPLRNSNKPQGGKIYWMFFGNGGNLVKPGDKVTVVIGEFRVENLVVE